MKTFLILSILFLNSHSLWSQEAIKMVRLNSQPIVIGELNGRKAYFLIDTGSDITFLNLKDAKKYKFRFNKRAFGKYRLSGLASEHRGELLIAYKTELHLGGRKMNGCYKVFDLSHIVESLWEDTGIQITGIIGSDLMKKHGFVIDYKAKEISFTRQ